MADNLIFPIGFDLEEAVKKAGHEWNSTYADKLEKLLAKRAITVNLGFSTKNLNNLDDVKRRLAELKIEPLTPENKTAIKDLVRELKELAKAMEKVQKYSNIQTPELQQALANKANAEAAHMAEKYRQANERLEVSKRRVALAEQKHAEALSNTSKKINEQHSYVSRLIKRMAVYASFSYAGNLLTSVREVTAQFELQRVSLGAIIQDQTRANALFSEIKAFALKSPVSILDLTKYTKQIAAYRIETEKLFDTTKMLTDISVGLGVDLQRITLFFGQVRARGALFSSEIRQATEAGIPLVELLAKKYSELNGQLVTASQVLKMVEKGMVGFEMVEEIFKDMTSAGGMFYEMQEKQGNTLYGLWAKLGDAAAVMYDEIGNTSLVNAGMKAAIQALTDLMKNWKDVARIATEAGIAFAIYKLAVIASTKATALATVWEKKDIVLRQMHLKTVMAQSWSVRTFNGVLLKCGVSMDKAAASTWIFSRALQGIKGAIAKTGIGAIVIALGLLVDHLLFSKSAAEQLKESLDNIETESIQEQDKSVRNFERLANIAVSASSTYKEQQAALEELKRTYKEIIPQEQLTIENLKQMNGNYELLTASIRRYIAERMKQKQTDEIINTYASEILKIQRKVNDDLKNKYSAEQLADFWTRYAENVKDSAKTIGKSVDEIVTMTVGEMGASMQFASDLLHSWSFSQASSGWINLYRLTRLIREQEKEIDALSKTYDSASMAMGEYAKSYSEAVDKITQDGLKLNGKVIKQEDNPLLYSQQEANLEIKDAMIPTIKEAFNAAGIAFNDGWISLIDNVDENMPQLTSSINFDPMVEKVNEESQKLLAELQKQLDALVAQREAYLKQIKAEEAKGKGGNDEVIQNAKARYNEIGDEIEKLEERARKINILPQLLEHLKKKYEDLAPSDSVVKLMRQRFDSIVDYTKAYAKNMRRFRMNADEDMEAYRKRLSDEVELIKKNIKAWTAAMILARLFRNKTEEQNLQNLIDEAKLQLKDLEKILGDMPVFDKSKSRSGTKSDPRLQNLKEEISLTKKLYDEYHKLEKQIGATKAAEKIQQIYSNTIKTLQDRATAYKFDFKLPFTDENLKANIQHFIDKMKELQGLKDKKGKPLFPNIGKEIDEAVAQLEDIDLNSLQKALEKKLKDLADRISRTKTAKEFYEKILGQTGNRDMAKRLVKGIFGENGSALNKEIAERMRKMVEGTSATLPDFVFNADMSVNTKALRGWVEASKAALGDVAKELTKFADESEKDTAKMVEGWLKATEKAKTYGDKLADVYRTTATEIARIEAEMAKGNLGREEGTELIAGYRRKEAEEIANLQYEAFKDSPMYVQMFDDLDHASTRMLENMKSRLESLQGAWRNLDPTQLKEMQSRLREIDEQLAKRNPFKALADGLREYAKLRTRGGARGNKSRQAADLDVTRTTEVYLKAEQEFAKLKSKPDVTEAELAGAAQMVTYTKQQKEEAEKLAANWLKVENAIGLSANELMKMLNWGGDIAKGIADISEAMGADEEDVQYWNDIASALNDVSGAIQDIVSSAMGGNVVGVISSTLTAVPKLFVGFSNLFSAGKIRKANKEIKRQQKLLEQLEYSYSRLENAAEKVFGADFVANQHQQERILRAQQQAYMKQYEAEKSKGKKADEDKMQEFLDKAREEGDEIADMHGRIAEKLLGTDLTSAARDFAQAWLDAYKEFGNTADAMSKKFREMIENMVVESLLARVMERALRPAFDMVDSMGDADFYSEDFWKRLMHTAEQGAQDADHGAAVIMAWVEKMGLNLRELGGEMTGISRDIATASEESVNGLAAGITTQNYYIAQQLAEIQRIRALVEAGLGGGTAAGNGLDYGSMHAEAMGHLGAISQHTAETVSECRNIAARCEEEVALLRRVIVARGGRATHGIAVYMQG